MKNWQFWILMVVLGIITFCLVDIILWMPKIHQELYEIALRLVK